MVLLQFFGRQYRLTAGRVGKKTKSLRGNGIVNGGRKLRLKGAQAAQSQLSALTPIYAEVSQELQRYNLM